MPSTPATFRPPRQRRAPALALLALACAALLALAALAPVPSAQAAQALAHSQDGSHTYYSVTDAWKAATSGTVIVMDDDWAMSSPLSFSEDQSAYIMMNGHKIYRSLESSTGNGSVVWLSKGSSLTLDGSEAQATFAIKNHADGDEVQVTCGGLLTGGMSTTTGGGVEMKEGSALTLINVEVAGNTVDSENGFQGAGVNMAGKGCKLTMTDSVIEYNRASYDLAHSSYGGGVYINGEDCSIVMTRSAISHNEAAMGGGVYIGKSHFKIDGNDTSSISYNACVTLGGGACVAPMSAGSSLGSIKGMWFEENTAQTGAGIWLGQANASLESCTFSSNKSSIDGGAAYIDSANTYLYNCTFIHNEATRHGGAVYIDTDNALIAGCTMTNNSSGQEGGAVFTDGHNVQLAQVVVIKGNMRGDGTADDIFLNTSSQNNTSSYLTGSVLKGSKVGVRTAETGARQIAENFPDNKCGSFFMDVDGYYVGYETDGTMWQRQGAPDYRLTVDGVDMGTYAQGDTVTVSATTNDPTKAFWYWSSDSSTGLDPLSEYVSDTANPTFSFIMPQNDVALVAQYVARIGAVALTVEAPRTGEALASTGKLAWTDAKGDAQVREIPISWTQTVNGQETVAESPAKTGAYYTASATISKDCEAGLAFALDMDTDDVVVLFRKSSGTLVNMGAASVSVDSATEALSVTSKSYIVPWPSLRSVKSAALTVPEGTDEATLRALLPTTAQGVNEIGGRVALTADAASADLSALLSEGHVTVPEGGKATVKLAVSAEGVENPDNLMLRLTVTVEPSYLQVTFDAAGSTPAPEAQSVRWGTGAQEPETPTLKGYTFLGWFAEDAESAWDFTTPVTSEVKLTAKWEPVKLAVTFDAAGGAPEPEAQSVPYGSCAQQPETPARAGFTFLGWFAENAESAWDFETPVTSALTLTAKWEATPPTSFQDVPEDAWYHEWVYLACERGLMTGYREGADGPFTGYFGPVDAITRGQVATVLWRMAGQPEAQEAAPFGEGDVVPGTYYYKAVAWCYEQEIITGYKSGPKANTFCPSDPVSREELALMVTRFERWAKVDTSGAPAANFDRCTDAASVSDWAADAVTWTAASGVLGGKEIPGESGTTYRLDPQQGATRAQAAKVFARAWEIQHGAAPYAGQQASEDAQASAAPAQAEAGTATQEATFDDVTFEDVAAASAQVGEGAVEETQATGNEGASTNFTTNKQQAAEDTQAAAEAQDADEAAPQPEFDPEPTLEASDDFPAEGAAYELAA